MSEVSNDCEEAFEGGGFPPAVKSEVAKATVRRRRKPSKNLTVVPDIAQPLPGWRGMWRRAAAFGQQGWRWLQARQRWQLESKRLALCETVSLGEKRFLAIVRVDGQHFLVGGAPSSVSMLAQLGGQGEFSGILQQHSRAGGAKA